MISDNCAIKFQGLIKEHFKRADNIKWKEALLCVLMSAIQFDAFGSLADGTWLTLARWYEFKKIVEKIP